MARADCQRRIEAGGGAGGFNDAASDARIRQAYFNDEAPRFRLVIADFGVLAGPFVISELT
ncbi:MAG: hypothetical protein KBF30_02470 [Hyphomonadaceae bacterium]|nr:hypothetical protein [Hyphomonadaceae bacterium]